MNFEQSTGQDAVDPFQLPAMVDVVFILLSFFVMATQLAVLESDYAMGYQSSPLGSGASAADLPASVPVQLRRVEGGVAITIGQAALNINDFDGIRRKLEEINLPDVDVILAGDPALTVDEFARGLDAVLASPMKKVSISRLTGGEASP